MRILVTGASGFVGSHVMNELLQRNHHVLALSRTPERAANQRWYNAVQSVACDIGDLSAIEKWIASQAIDTLVHLAWPGLPNYKDLFHFETNLPASYALVKRAVQSGVSKVLVTGTCFEYGLQNGRLNESTITTPSTPYGLAKDCLRKFLEGLQQHSNFQLIWARLFYMYGSGQNPRSLLAQLQSATERGDQEFPMSGGQQLRDYLSVECVARHLVDLLELNDNVGVINVCSGTPISVRALVENWLATQGHSIKLQLGHYAYPDFEPFAFWGDNSKLESLRRKG